MACEHGHAAVVDIIVRDAALAPAAAAGSSEHGPAPLQVAAKNGHSAVIRALLEARAEPGAADKLGLTALHRACERGHTESGSGVLERAYQMQWLQ